MIAQEIDGITLLYDVNEQDSAPLFANACEIGAGLIHDTWGLEAPGFCRVYIMTSWMKFAFHSASWPRRILYGITLPLWSARVRKLWPWVSGWTLINRHRPAVGVKPPRLAQAADTRIGKNIYLKNDDLNNKVQSAICHELTHAFTADLGLPWWLSEGIAMVTVDRFAGKPTVKPGTIEIIRSYSPKTRPARLQKLGRMNTDRIVYLYVRGYWITRYLEDLHPGLVKHMLLNFRNAMHLEQQLAGELGIRPDMFWREIDQVVVDHFAQIS